MKQRNVLIGILGGFAIGATLGVLFAPDKGCNTRNKISKTGKDLKNNINETIKEMVDYLISTAESKYGQLASSAENAIDAGKQKLERLKTETT